MIEFIQDFICGSLSGVSSCLSGYILDTLKVRMQLDPTISMVPALRQALQSEGFLKLFNGIYYPLMTIPLINAVTFSSYQTYKTIRGKSQLSFWDGLENGAFSGFVIAFVVTPVQLVKCNMQALEDRSVSSKTYLRKVIKEKGIHGLFKGFIPTVFRYAVIPSYSVQFATYQGLKLKFVDDRKPHLSLNEALIVGPLAAINAEILSYPQDIIKTKIQVRPAGTFKRCALFNDGGFFDCWIKTWKNNGIKGFMVGMKPCLIRAMFADGLAIVVYQKSQQTWSKIFHKY